MKAKKILFKIAGILQFIASGIIAFFAAVLLLIRPLVNLVIDNAYIAFQEEMKELSAEELAAMDESMRFLIDSSQEEFSAFFLKWTMIFSLFALAVAIVGIVFGVIFIKCSKKYEYILKGRKVRKIILGILTGIFCGLNISALLVIIALCIRDYKKENFVETEIKKNLEENHENKQEK